MWDEGRIARPHGLLAAFLSEAKAAGVKVYAICSGRMEEVVEPLQRTE